MAIQAKLVDEIVGVQNPTFSLFSVLHDNLLAHERLRTGVARPLRNPIQSCRGNS
jgi:hypothetical protein